MDALTHSLRGTAKVTSEAWARPSGESQPSSEGGRGEGTSGVVLVYGARLLLIISGVRISHLYKSPLWWPYLKAPDTPSLLKRPNPLRNG